MADSALFAPLINANQQVNLKIKQLPTVGKLIWLEASHCLLIKQVKSKNTEAFRLHLTRNTKIP